MVLGISYATDTANIPLIQCAVVQKSQRHADLRGMLKNVPKRVH
jgi:hypothetical protein